MLIGDTHCDRHFLVNRMDLAGALGIQHAFVLGDFGIFPRFVETVNFLDVVNEAARKNGVTVYALRGNHDDPDWWAWNVEHNPHHKGFGMVRRHIQLSPTVNYWTWAGKKFLVVGGAVSIDRTDRVRREEKPLTEWWPNEQLSDKDLARVGDGVHVDYLLTHDCSNDTPFKYRLKDDVDSTEHRRKIDEVIKRSRPDMHFHGHMHEKYDWVNMPYSTDHQTQTYGLECNGMWYSWGILDTDTNVFLWRGDEGLPTSEIQKITAPLGDGGERDDNTIKQ
jgi:hypothetical protein